MQAMHLLLGVAIQPNLELKTLPKQLLGSPPLVIELPDFPDSLWLAKEIFDKRLKVTLFGLGNARFSVSN